MQQNELPEGWAECEIREIADVYGGKRLPKGHTYSQEKTNYPYIRVENFRNGSIDDSSLKYLQQSTRDVISNYVISKDDLYISIAGSIGKVGTIPEQLNGANLTENAAKICNFSPINKEYLSFLLNSEICQEQMQIKTISTNQPKLALFKIKDIELPLPPLPEQHRIVAAIEALFARLDATNERLDRVPGIMKTFRQAVLAAACDGRLTEDWREEQKDLPDARELLEQIHTEREKTAKASGKKVKSVIPLSEDEVEELPRLPMSWEWTKIDYLVENGKNSIKAGPFGSSLKKECYVPSGFKIYGQEQVISGDSAYGDYYISENKYKELESCKVQPFDVLISLVGTIGKVLILPEKCEAGIINPRLIKLSLNRNHYLPVFFKYYFESMFLKNLYKMKSHGGTMDILNLSIIKELPFPLCSISEQQEIVRRVDALFAFADSIEAKVAVAREKMEKLRQSILAKAFSGELVPTEAELARQEGRDYELAEVLLKRIKAEGKSGKK